LDFNHSKNTKIEFLCSFAFSEKRVNQQKYFDLLGK